MNGLNKKLLNTQDLAKLLNVSTRSIRRWMKQGDLPRHFKTPGQRFYLFDYQDVLDWIEKLKKERE